MSTIIEVQRQAVISAVVMAVELVLDDDKPPDGRTLPRLYPTVPVHRGGSAFAARFTAWQLQCSDVEFRNLFRMTKPQFRQLVIWLRWGRHLEDTRYQFVEQKLMIYLWILAFGEPQRNAAHRFRIAQSTVSAI